MPAKPSDGVVIPYACHGWVVTKILDEVLAANAKYAENFGDKGNLPLPPSRHLRS